MSAEQREELRRKVEMAFSVLRSAKLRAAYNAFLDEPDSFFTFFSSLRRAHERLFSMLSALLLILLFASVAQSIHHSYNQKNKLEALKSKDAFQKAVRRAAEERHGSKIRKLPPSEEEKIRNEIADELAIEWAEENGVSIQQELAASDLAIVRFLLLPVYLFRYIHSHIRWVWLFRICKAPYGDEEKLYLTRNALNMSAKEWASLRSGDAEHYLSMELWKAENLEKYQTEMEEVERQSRIHSGKYRQQKRRARKGATPFNYNED